MLKEIGDVKNIPKFIEEVKAKKKILYGFGHRMYDICLKLTKQ